MFAYGSRTDIQIHSKCGMLIPWDQNKILERSKLQKKFLLSWNPGEGCSSSSESKHDRRMMPQPKLLFQRQDYRKRAHNPENLSLVPSPIEDCFVAWRQSTIKDWHQYYICLLLRRLQEQRLQPWNFVPDLSPSEDGLCILETKHVKRTGPRAMIGLS
jgi:hypothetical protein